MAVGAIGPLPSQCILHRRDSFAGPRRCIRTAGWSSRRRISMTTRITSRAGRRSGVAFERKVFLSVGLIAAIGGLVGCTSPEAREGLAIGESESACVALGDSTAVLQIPIAIRSSGTSGVAINHLKLLSPKNMKIVGFSLFDPDTPAYSSEKLPPNEVVESLRQRGQNVQPVQELEMGGGRKLTVLLEVETEGSLASAEGIRIEWVSGEPVYYQDTTSSLRIKEECTVGSTGSEPPAE